MRIGIAYDLTADVAKGPACPPQPDDRFEEYDSEETIAAISAVLSEAGHTVVPLGGGRAFLERVLGRAARGPTVDLVFNIAEGRRSRTREAHVPTVCEMLGIPYTHSDPLTLALSLDKALTKRVAASHGVPTAPFALVEGPEDLAETPLPPFPVVAKPNAEGSSIGIRRHSRCDTREALRDAVGWLWEHYRQPVLVETFLPGVEATVAVFGAGREARIAAIMEIAPRRGALSHFLYSVEVKRNYTEEVDYHVPPRLPPAAVAAIGSTALGAYRALGCRDVARVDVRCDADGVPCLLEVNPLPGLNPVSSDLPIACERAHLPYRDVIACIVDHAVARQFAPAPAGRGWQ